MPNGFRKSTFSDKLLSWWRGTKESSTDRAAAMNACLEDPDGALAALQEEQGRIAQELEETFLAYDQKLQRMAKRLAGVDGTPPTTKELQRLHEEQLELWRLVRRTQAAQRSTHALERELREWGSQTQTAVETGHPDHPQTRQEVVRSELAIRGARADVSPRFEAARASGVSSPGFSRTLIQQDPESDAAEEVSLEVDSFGTSAPLSQGPEWEHDSDEHLLRELASREREITKLLTIPNDPAAGAEIALLARELRELHTHLRQHDRRNRVTRVRWRMGIPA